MLASKPWVVRGKPPVDGARTNDSHSRSITPRQKPKDLLLASFTWGVVREGVAKRGVDDAEEDALRQARDRLGLVLVQLPQGREPSELSERERQHHLRGAT